MFDAINLFSLFIGSMFLSLVTIFFAAKSAHTINIVDHPGGHKQHENGTPCVGGVGVYFVLCVALLVLNFFFPEDSQKWLILGFCATLIFIIGIIDDMFQLSYKYRLIVQLIVALVMVFIGNIVLYDLGALLPVQLVESVALPFTVFAIIGGINIINMIDGTDGLSGSVALVSFLLLGVVTYTAGDMPYFILIMMLIGSLIGFLYFNLRLPSRSNARVFLGDNGSMLIGFLFAWLLVDISQRPNADLKPVVAIWLLSIPLIDAVGVIHRRVLMGVSPFKADRNHLHHILLRAGYRNEEVVFSIVSLHLLLGLIGLAGLYLNIPDLILFFGFLLIYALFFSLMFRPWHFIPALSFMHVFFGITPIADCNTFLGRYKKKHSLILTRIICKDLRAKVDYWVRIFKQPITNCNAEACYATVLKIRIPKDPDSNDTRIKKYIELLQHRLKKKYGVRLHQLTRRKGDLDWSVRDRHDKDFGEWSLRDRRVTKYRSLDSHVLAFEATWDTTEYSQK